MAGSCEHGNGLWNYINGGELLCQLRKCNLLKTDLFIEVNRVPYKGLTLRVSVTSQSLYSVLKERVNW
jgi:hypothetical protein